MKIYLGTDHAGFELKEKLKVFLMAEGYSVEDKGARAFDAQDDYPDFIRPVAEAVASEEGSLGIILGGSGQGEAMCANRVKGARAAVFYGPMLPVGAADVSGRMSSDPFELITLAREHNNANILSLGARFLSDDDAKKAAQLFVEGTFSGAERNLRRIKKLDN